MVSVRVKSFPLFGRVKRVGWEFLSLPRSEFIPGKDRNFSYRISEILCQDPAVTEAIKSSGTDLCVATDPDCGCWILAAADRPMTKWTRSLWDEANTAPGLALLGVGAVIGSFGGGFIAGRARRLDWLAAISLAGGVVAGLLFALGASAWIVVAMAFVASVLVSVSAPVLLTLIMHLAGQSRGTAGGMLSTSNQFGSFVGASAGGLMLSLGGFPAVGLLCLVATVLSASVVGLRMRRSPAFQLGGAGT